MKRFMWMVACALLLMTVPMVQGCSDDDDEQEEKEFVIPTAPEDILEYIQGKWVGTELTDPYLSLCMEIKNDTVLLSYVNKNTNLVDLEGVCTLKCEDGKLLSYSEGYIEQVVNQITIPEEGVMHMKNPEFDAPMTVKRQDFTLPSLSMEGWMSVLNGVWKCDKAVHPYISYNLEFSGTACTWSGQKSGEELPTWLEGMNLLMKDGELILEGIRNKLR